MSDKYSALGKEYEDTINELAQAANWSEAQAGRVLAVLLHVSEDKAKDVTKQCRKGKKTEKLESTRSLLENYRRLKWSIECGTEHTIKLLADSEYQRLMEMEESLHNQQLQSTALHTARNRVLWTRLNAALDCFREMCENDPSPQVQRQYKIIYHRYLSSQNIPPESVMELLSVERSQFYKGIRDAVKTLSVILFGADSMDVFS